jgi:hypothetical protein
MKTFFSPSHSRLFVQYSSCLPEKGSVQLTLSELEKMCNFTFKEGVSCSDEVYAWLIKNDEELRKTRQSVPRCRLQDCIESPFKNIALFNAGPPFGMCTVATGAISRHTVIGLYSGVMHFGRLPTDRYEFKINLPDKLDHTGLSMTSNELGGMARFFPHLMSRTEKDKDPAWIEMTGNHVAPAWANVESVSIMLDCIPVIVLQAKSDINKGDIVGYDYGRDYWLSHGVESDLMDRSGKLIPKDDWKWKGRLRVACQSLVQVTNTLAVNVDAILSSDTGMHAFPSITIGSDPQGQKHFYSTRVLVDSLVAANALPKYYGKLPNLLSSLPFVAMLMHFFSQQKGNELALYWQNPKIVGKDDRTDFDDQCKSYVLDVVLSCRDNSSYKLAISVLQGMLQDHCTVCPKAREIRVNAANLNVAKKSRSFHDRMLSLGLLRKFEDVAVPATVTADTIESKRLQCLPQQQEGGGSHGDKDSSLAASGNYEQYSFEACLERLFKVRDQRLLQVKPEPCSAATAAGAGGMFGSDCSHRKSKEGRSDPDCNPQDPLAGLAGGLGSMFG